MPYNCPKQAIKYLKTEMLLDSLGPIIESFAKKYSLKTIDMKRGWSERFLANYEEEELTIEYSKEHPEEKKKKIFKHVQIWPLDEGKKLEIRSTAWNDSEVEDGKTMKRKGIVERTVVGGQESLDIMEFSKALGKACERTLSWELEELVETWVDEVV